MQRLVSLRQTCRLILVSLFPVRPGRLVTNNIVINTRDHYIIFHTIIAAKKIPPHVHDPDYTGDPVDTVRLFFPGAHPLAAPFMLFRLKRTGFSSCRIIVKDGGLLLTATRWLLATSCFAETSAEKP